MLILAVNKTNAPVRAVFSIHRSFKGKAKVVFENRLVTMNGGSFSDIISSYGSQAYLIDINPIKENVKLWKGNLILDPGFEDISSPGVPSACYARGNGERGATYFLDSREHIEGYHSLRLITPTDNGSAKMRFFPVSVRPGATYMVSVWAKTDIEQIHDKKNISKLKYFEISMGDYGITRFSMGSDWQQFVTFVTIPYFHDIPSKTNLILQMPSSGVAWFDLLHVSECVDIEESTNPEIWLPGKDF
jgi:hypothetical protein